jgi:hypothetical protein
MPFKVQAALKHPKWNRWSWVLKNICLLETVHNSHGISAFILYIVSKPLSFERRANCLLGLVIGDSLLSNKTSSYLFIYPCDNHNVDLYVHPTATIVSACRLIQCSLQCCFRKKNNSWNITAYFSCLTMYNTLWFGQYWCSVVAKI